MPHPSITSSGVGFRRDATNLRLIPPIKSIPGKVRLVKDLLSVGEWPIGATADGTVQKWTVTQSTLDDIARVFCDQKGQGQTRPLQWKHADTESGVANVDARDVVDYWDELFVEGPTLWGVIYTTEDDAKTLTKVNRPISVGVDYLGNVLTPGTVTPVKNALLHVALVDQGAMPGQGPFVQMAAPKGTKTMDFAALVEAINTLLEALNPGAKLPEGVDESNINLALSMAVSLLTGGEVEATEDDPPEVGPVDTGMPPELAQMRAQMAQLTASMKIVLGNRETESQSAFTDRVDEMIEAGTPASARDSLIEVGKATKWDLSKLDGLMPSTVQLGSRLGKVQPPKKQNADELAQEFRRAGFAPHVAKRMADKRVAAQV